MWLALGLCFFIMLGYMGFLSVIMVTSSVIYWVKPPHNMSHPSGLPSFLLPYFFTLILAKLPFEGWVETLIPMTNLVFVSTIRPMAKGLSLVCSNVWRSSNCTLEYLLCSFSSLTCAFLAIKTIAAGHKPFVARAAVSALADGVVRLWILVRSRTPSPRARHHLFHGVGIT